MTSGGQGARRYEDIDEDVAGVGERALADERLRML
jgi:hypothetical protein